MADRLGSYLDELVSERPQRPVLDGLGQCQPPQEVAQVIGQGKKLKPNLIVHKIVARKPCPVQCVFALLDPLFCCPTLVAELTAENAETAEEKSRLKISASSAHSAVKSAIPLWQPLFGGCPNWPLDTESYDTGQSASWADARQDESANERSSHLEQHLPSFGWCRSTPLLRDSDTHGDQQNPHLRGRIGGCHSLGNVQRLVPIHSAGHQHYEHCHCEEVLAPYRHTD